MRVYDSYSYRTKFEMTDCLLCGSFGFGNVGDEAIFDAFSDLLKKVRRPLNVNVLTRYRSPQLQSYGMPLSVDDDKRSLDKILAHIPVIVAGGGIFEPGPNAVAFRCFKALTAATRKLSFLGCSFEPGRYGFFQTRWTRALMKRSRVFTVRDKWSLKLAKEVGRGEVECVGDLVLSMDPQDKPHQYKVEDERYMVVSVCPRWEGDEWYSWLARELVELSKSFQTRIVFLPMASRNDGDVLVAQSIARIMTEEFAFDNFDIRQEQATPRETLQIIANSALVIGMRLHACVMACASHVPCIPIAYHPKLMAFAVTMGLESVTFPNFQFEERRELHEWRFCRSSFDSGLICKLAERAMSIEVDVDYFKEIQREALSEILSSIEG